MERLSKWQGRIIARSKGEKHENKRGKEKEMKMKVPLEWEKGRL